MDAEGLLRHRVRGIIAAAEGRAEHLLDGARRDALDARHDAALDALDAVAEVERELRLALERLTATSTRLRASLEDGSASRESGEASPEDGAASSEALPPPGGTTRERQRLVGEQLSTADGRKTFARASMRERPVAALFGATPSPAEVEPENGPDGRRGPPPG
jgi:hypothetical protein